jgi:1-acyl-sn-glycerol-3-phosphate acyltransferase
LIKAEHKQWADTIFKNYVKHLFKKQFATLNLIGDIPHIQRDVPTIILPNHNTWWDGFFVYFLNSHFFQRRLYMMMLEEQLHKYPFFRRLGAYGIIPDKPEDVRKTLSYTLKIISETHEEGVAVCIFPQGELVSWYQQPLNFQRGLEVIARRSVKQITYLPLMIRIEYIEEQYPKVFFMFGSPKVIEPTKGLQIEQFARSSEALRNLMKTELIKKNHGTILFTGHRSVHKKFTTIRTLINRNKKDNRW